MFDMSVFQPRSGDRSLPAPEFNEHLNRRHLIVSSAPFLALLAAPAMAQPAQPVDLGQFQGKVVYLDFWASWCAPCQLSFPFMDRLTKTYRPKDLAVVAVNVDHARDKADAFLHKFGGGVPVVFDPAGKYAERFSVKDMPTSILIGRDGKQRFTHEGFFENQVPTYTSQIETLIHEK